MGGRDLVSFSEVSPAGLQRVTRPLLHLGIPGPLKQAREKNARLSALKTSVGGLQELRSYRKPRRYLRSLCRPTFSRNAQGFALFR